ncbi:MAG: hypothetical protein HOV83_08180 [Catenulispora sp.]|nr:hypothetical protein [Catenulispora sp.]
MSAAPAPSSGSPSGQPSSYGLRPDLSGATDDDLVAELAAPSGPPSRKLAAAGELARRATADPALFRRLFDTVLPDPHLHARTHHGLTPGRLLLAELTQADRDTVAAELPALLDRLAAAGVSTTGWTSWLGIT